MGREGGFLAVISRYIEHEDFFHSLYYKCDRPTGRSIDRANLESVIGPGTDLEEAALRVVREILDVHETGRLVNGRRLPVDRAVEVDGRLRHHCHLVVAVRAAADRG